jgi:hypothetical protein
MQLHPLCTLFPRMSGYEFDCLKLDIQENGQREPIITHEGMILDGGNRYAACVELGIEPSLMKFGGDNLATYVLSANLHRRHLTPGQQAAIVACVQDWSKAQPASRPNKECNVAPLSTSADRAAQSGASIRTQKTADKVAKANPELAKEVARGEKTLPQAEKEAFPKPIQPVEKEEVPEEDHHIYTEIDEKNDQIAALQDIVAVGYMDASPEEKKAAEELISELRKRIRTLEAVLASTESQRDSYMREVKQLKNQCEINRKTIKKLEGK